MGVGGVGRVNVVGSWVNVARVDTVVRGQGWQNNNFKNRCRNFSEIIFFKFFLYGKKENFEEYSLNLAFAKLSFPTLINYSVGRCRTCPRPTVVDLDFLCYCFGGGYRGFE
jgi:hypothetical protein